MVNGLSRRQRKLGAFFVAEAPLLALLAVTSGLILAFLQIADEMAEGETEAFDRAILMAFRNPADPNHPIRPVWVMSPL